MTTENAETIEATPENMAIPADKRKMSDGAFKKQLSDFVLNLKSTKRAAHALAVAAAAHFVEHGDTSRCQQLLDVFEGAGKNFVRVAAYKEWLRVHFPIAMDLDTKQLIKKPDAEFDEKLIEEAYTTTFWDFKPDQEVMEWDETSVIKMLKAGVRRLENDKHKPKDDDATVALVQVKKLITKLEAAA